MSEFRQCKVFSNELYPGKMLLNLHNLLQSECFCDAEIVAGGEIFRVHRLVLASSCTYFRAMFTAPMKESQKERIELKEIPANVFSLILNFIYTGQVFLSQSTVQDVLAAADMLGLPEIIEACTDYLRNEFHCTNVLGIYRFAEAHTCDKLQTQAFAYICRNFPYVAEEDEFLEIPKETLVLLLDSEKLKVSHEIEVLQAALRWLNHNVKERKPFVFEVLKLVRLLLIPTRLIEQAETSLQDVSIRIALKSLHRSVQSKKGSLANLLAHPRKSAKKYMYVIGGSHKSIGSGWKQLSESTLANVLCLDTFKKTWNSVSSMEIERILPGVTALDGLIYVVGGEQESKILANGEVYSPQEDTWSPIEPMIIPRCAFGLTTWENYIFAFGGWIGEDIGGSIERYDSYLNEWTMVGDMEEPRFSMGVFTHLGLIYILGGCTHEHRHSRELSSFNPVTCEWTKLAPMKVSRSQMGYAVLNKDHLYVVGGSSRHAEVLKSVERYSFEDNRWMDVCPMKVGRANPAVGAADGKIYVAGGDQSHESNFFRAQITLASCECYDPLSDSWDDCESLPESRSEAGIVVI